MLTIRDATIDDAVQKGLVHYQAWQETYTGLMNDTYIKNMKAENCISLAQRYYENTLVAIIDDTLAGFACYGSCKDKGMEDFGEIIALYLLKEYQKQGIGKALLEACIGRLNNYNKYCLWVLNTNHKAIEFYKKAGFEFNGEEKQEILISPITELRMIK